MTTSAATYRPRDRDIAIIGMAARLPGARNVEEFWANLRAGRETITRFTEAELRAAGVDPALLAARDYVRANAILPEAERFDAAFFGYTPREAELLDVQHRVFLECAWTAIEHAGYDPLASRGAFGVFAGAGLNTYLLRQVMANPAAVASAGGFQVMLANDKDFLATRVSYKLNLRGPSLAVQTACSTSLVAVHLACQSLLAGECETALAGGVAIRVPQIEGYLYQEGMILSPDGHCRAFDRHAAGTVGGNGAAAVVLKRAEDALADGDTIHAIIRGSAINNDGSGKVGYTAPGIEGQESVIAEALAVAGVSPDEIGYVEAHGTGTALGDPVEVAALTRAFRRGTGRNQFCAIGSVKSNLGHLDAAAGVTGLIKAVLALQHREIPPSLHFSAPNPQIDFAAGPFRVAAQLEPWPTGAGGTRCGGVSSFGLGGTNVHVVIAEAPSAARGNDAATWKLLPVSGRTRTALSRAAQNLAAHLEKNPDVNLADVAWTLAVGRRSFAERGFVLARDARGAAAALRASDGSFDRVPAAPPDEPARALWTAGRAWREGKSVDWAAIFDGADRRRVPLPTYPFEGERYWIEAAPAVDGGGGRGLASAQPEQTQRADLADWFYLPSWQRALAPVDLPALTDGDWFVLADAAGLAAKVVARLRAAGAVVSETKPGEDGSAALRALDRAGRSPRWIVSLGNVATGEGEAGFNALFALARTLAGARLPAGARLTVVVNGLHAFAHEQPLQPEKALLLGPVRVLPKEVPGLATRVIDVVWPAADVEALVNAVLVEARGGTEEFVALRGRERWVHTTEPVRIKGAGNSRLRERGVYLITGGLGGMGLVLAEDLARRVKARLVLIGRAGPDDEAQARLEALRVLGAEVMIAAVDVTDETALRRLVGEVGSRFGSLNGVIHAAGVAGGGVLVRRTDAQVASVLAPKVAGTRALHRVLGATPLDFLVLMSGLTAQLAEFGQADYAGANAFLDAYATEQNGRGAPVLSIAWDAWRETGMAARIKAGEELGPEAVERRAWRISNAEGVEVFHRALACGAPHVIVSTHDLAKRRAALGRTDSDPGPALAVAIAAKRHPRPALAEAFVAPRDPAEEQIAEIWRELLGLEEIGVADNFFALGGHSLLATQVLARLRGGRGSELTLAGFFETPTVAGLAQRLAAGLAARDEPRLRPVPRHGLGPLSFAQEALWLVDRMTGQSVHYNEFGAWRMRGPIDARALAGAMTAVVRRHEVLRTRLVERAGEARQEILPPFAVELAVEEIAEAEFLPRATEFVAQPFELSEGPPWRAQLMRLGRDDHVLMFVVHHIVFDGWSSGVLVREVVTAYGALVRGALPDLPPLPVQYADFAVWQRARLTGSRRDELVAYWRRQLGGRLPVLELPADRPRPAAQSFRGRKLAVDLGADLTARLEKLGRDQGGSLFMALLAGYAALLGRTAPADEVVVGCPIAGRDQHELEPLIGCFINPLALRVNLAGNPTFAGFLERVCGTVLAAYAHAELPFAQVVEAVRPARDPARSALFQAMLIFQNATPPAAVPAGMTLEPWELPEGPARSDFDLYLWEKPDGVRGYLIYNTDIFAERTAQRFAARFRALLAAAVAAPTTRLADLRLETEASLPRLASRSTNAPTF